MKKRLNHIATMMAAALLLLPLLASCSSDDADNSDNGGKTSDTPVTISLNMTAQEQTTSRAATWTSAANDAEKMTNWFVIITAKDSKNIVGYAAQSCSATEKDTYNGSISLSNTGDYDFYSFANLQPTDIGFTTTPSVGSEIPDFSKQTFTANANGFDATVSGAKIPMSNKQTISITASGTVDLWVVRMFAKIELKLTNAMASDLTVTKATLSDITKNMTNNIMLLPNPIGYGDEKACSTNLNGSPETETLTYTPTSPIEVKAGNTDAPTLLTFYVNESTLPTNNHGLFILSLETKTGTSEKSEMRYALISNNSDGEWSFIARNDYRIIPITLDNYEFRLDIFQSEAIGVLPYWEYSDGIYTCTFYNGEEHFHIAPLIKRISDGVALKYGTEAGTWTVDETSTDGLPNCWQVVGTENTDIFNSATTATHASDNGGAPRWSSADHFAFGKFAKQSVTGKSTYKMTVIVNRDGANASPAQRTYTYQLCIVRENLSDTRSSYNKQSPTRSLFGYGKLLKAEQR